MLNLAILLRILFVLDFWWGITTGSNGFYAICCRSRVY